MLTLTRKKAERERVALGAWRDLCRKLEEVRQLARTIMGCELAGPIFPPAARRGIQATGWPDEGWEAVVRAVAAIDFDAENIGSTLEGMWPLSGSPAEYDEATDHRQTMTRMARVWNEALEELRERRRCRA